MTSIVASNICLKTNDGEIWCEGPKIVQRSTLNTIQVEIKGGPDQETPLHIAASIQDGERCADMLVKSGANVNATNDVRHCVFIIT